MRVNSRVYDEKQDMLGVLRIPNCPSEFRVIAENILAMATKPGYAVSDYHTMTELDKNLMWDYWREFDGAKPVMNCDTIADMREWFIKKATPPELIRRARQWLVEHKYLILKEDVLSRAQSAGQKFSRSVKQG